MLFLFNSMRDLHEHLTYFSKPEDKSAISKIQLYLNYYLTYFKMANALDENKNEPVFTLKINLNINGVTYTESSEGIIDALAQLADADGFDLDVRYYGKKGDISKEMGESSLRYLDVVDNHYGMSEYLKNSSDRNLEYKMMAYYGDSDAFASRYINADGYIDNYLEECGTVTESGNGYYLCPTNNLSILANFEFTWPQVISLMMSALAAGLTVGGKAVGKGFAVSSSTKIVHGVGKLLYTLRHFSRKPSKKK